MESPEQTPLGSLFVINTVGEGFTRIDIAAESLQPVARSIALKLIICIPGDKN